MNFRFLQFFSIGKQYYIFIGEAESLSIRYSLEDSEETLMWDTRCIEIIVMNRKSSQVNSSKE